MIEDKYLTDAITSLRVNWQDPGVGIVAAVLVGPHGQTVSSLSTYEGEGRFSHAEANALKLHFQWLGKVAPGTKAVVTLSPCIQLNPETRVGKSCTEMLLENGISQVHVGHLDTFQLPSIAAYQELGLQVTVTEDPQLGSICRALANLFGQYVDRRQPGENPWPEIKKEVGFPPFGK
ncbi:MAG: hypothetical protein Q7S31_00260 [bacterium]|nr:hypothetical protein [bacterium]